MPSIWARIEYSNIQQIRNVEFPILAPSSCEPIARGTYRSPMTVERADQSETAGKLPCRARGHTQFAVANERVIVPQEPAKADMKAK